MRTKRINATAFSLASWIRPVHSGLSFAGVLFACYTSAYGGKIIVDNDEWTLSKSAIRCWRSRAGSTARCTALARSRI
jgi:hypothetical protein